MCCLVFKAEMGGHQDMLFAQAGPLSQSNLLRLGRALLNDPFGPALLHPQLSLPELLDLTFVRKNLFSCKQQVYICFGKFTEEVSSHLTSTPGPLLEPRFPWPRIDATP